MTVVNAGRRRGHGTLVSPALFPAFLKDVPALCGYVSSPDAAIGVCGSPAVYRPRDPHAASLFELVEDNFDELERVWDERYERQHGFPVKGPQIVRCYGRYSNVC